MAKTIVLVDDERIVIYGIRSLLSELNAHYEVSGIFRNGEECLRFCLEHPPDLLFTDICMPGMGGLDLIKGIRARNRDIKIVALSCHDEFDLVHDAFLLGADDYILKKDIDRDSLLELLERMLPEREYAEIPDRRTGLPSFEKCMEKQSDYPGFLAIIAFRGECTGGDEETAWQPDLPMLHQIVQQEAGNSSHCYIGPGNELVLHFPSQCACHDTAKNPVLEGIRRTLSKYVNRTVFVAGCYMEEGAVYKKAYGKCIKILDSSFYTAESAVLSGATVEPQRDGALKFSLIEADLKEAWIQSVHEYLCEAKQNVYSSQAVKAEIIFAIKQLFHHLQENLEYGFTDPSLEDGKPYYQCIGGYSEIIGMEKWVRMFLTRVAERLKESSQHRGVVYTVKLYVKEKLQGDVSLNVVAKRFNVHASSLSTLFRKETGENYIEYVNRKRVEKACELLRTTELSAKELAFRCGYANPNYFSRIFKKTTGMTVSEYKFKGESKNCEPMDKNSDTAVSYV